ncbi:MAG: CDP-diacylglycerol--glycerol-3-phosphate 3-phosphatidyltransferase [Clostridiales bacterium]|nr:MAG: CDP-diacylglycerol--glycerol-3-phosphate 3-phosphatidyltransferase [Clostridiales bacterium]
MNLYKLKKSRPGGNFRRFAVKLNLPNKLTIARMVMVPFLMIFIAFDFGLGVWSRLIAAVFFGAASFTDFVDGHIARRDGLVTNFGKFLDPLADKLMVFVALISLCYVTGRDEGRSVYGILLLAATVIVIFRELAVTSMRMVVTNTDGIVIAAGFLGKVKTCTQILFILVALLEPVVWSGHIASYITMAAMAVMTVWSGVSYFRSYWKYINPAQ